MTLQHLDTVHLAFFTSVSHDSSSRNLNSFQRIHFLSRNIKLSIVACKDATFPSAHQSSLIYRAPLPGKLMLIIYGTYWLIRYHGCQPVAGIITEPSIIGILGFFGKLLYNIQWIVDVWDIPFRHYSSSPFIRLRMTLSKAIFKVLYRYADLFVVVAALSELELSYFKLDESKMLLLDNAIWINDESYQQSQKSRTDGFVILCSRSIYTEHMGLDVLASAFVKLKPKLADISLLIIGDVTKEAQPQLKILENQKDVEITGFVEYGKLRELIAGADICIVPFRNVPDLAQTCPTTILQYFVLRKPIIAPRIRGIQNMINDGSNGLLFGAGDADDLASKIELLYKDNGLRKRIAEGARKSASKYDCREKNRIIIERIQKLISQRQP